MTRTGLTKVRPRGQVTIPSAMRKALGIRAGDIVFLRATGPASIEMTITPHLTLDELIARYPIEGPINEEADREAWQAEAVKDVIGR